jgi:hypothetical protein
MKKKEQGATGKAKKLRIMEVNLVVKNTRKFSQATGSGRLKSVTFPAALSGPSFSGSCIQDNYGGKF